jgi:hypothetical protein
MVSRYGNAADVVFMSGNQRKNRPEPCADSDAGEAAQF